MWVRVRRHRRIVEDERNEGKRRERVVWHEQKKNRKNDAVEDNKEETFSQLGVFDEEMDTFWKRERYGISMSRRILYGKSAPLGMSTVYG